MSKKKIKYIHLFIWLFAIFANLPYTNFQQGMEPKFIVSYIIGFLYLMIVFYLFYLLIVPYFLKRKKLIEFFSISFIVVLIIPFFGYTTLFLARALFEGTFQHFYRGYTLKMHMSGYYPVLTASVFGSFFSVIINWFTTMNQKAELDKQKLAVELDLLKSKLNPHFLFNTLNNIDSLIHKDPDEASSALIRLSEIMRYLTYETSSDVVSLKSEIEYIRNYIELHRMRIRTPDDIRFEVDGDSSIMIAPALFVPLIENAFKFASFRNRKPCVDISITSSVGIVSFEARNYYDNTSKSENEHSGFGIINLRKRLELTYPGKYQFIVNKEDTSFFTKLIIDTNAD
jgi:two-component system, LytTR family, sensor kinase